MEGYSGVLGFCLNLYYKFYKEMERECVFKNGAFKILNHHRQLSLCNEKSSLYSSFLELNDLV